MFLLDHVLRILAALLLTVPIPDSEAARITSLVLAVRPVMRRVALDLEVMDPREARHTLTRAEDLAGDVGRLRDRYRDLHDALPLHDAMMWPSRELVNDLLAFNRAHRCWLDAQQEMGGPDVWEVREAIVEVDRLYTLWDIVRDAKCDYYYVTVRRHALKRLREQIGHEAYYAGRLPPVVPLHRFREIR